MQQNLASRSNKYSIFLYFNYPWRRETPNIYVSKCSLESENRHSSWFRELRHSQPRFLFLFFFESHTKIRREISLSGVRRDTPRFVLRMSSTRTSRCNSFNAYLFSFYISIGGNRLPFYPRLNIHYGLETECLKRTNYVK